MRLKEVLGHLVSAVAMLSVLIPAHASSLMQMDCDKKDHSGRQIYGAQCATLTVPENYEATDGRKIKLNVLRLPAVKESGKPPLFFFAGGPGQAATEIAPIMIQSLSALNINHDFVFIDQRGTGKSHPLDCSFNPLDFAHMSPKQAQKESEKALKNCIESYDADLAYYSTPHAIKDFERVRQAYDYDRIFVWGASYGTRVVLAYLREADEVIAGAVLDGLAPIELQVPLHFEQDSANALNALLTHCENIPTCNEAFPRLRNRWIEKLDELESSPVNSVMQHPRTGESINVFIDDRVLSGWVRGILYSHQAAPILTLALDRAANGDYHLLFNSVVTFFDQQTDSISLGMHWTVICAEDQRHAHETPLPVDKKNPLLRLGETDDIKNICHYFPQGNVPASYFEPFTSQAPALLLSGRFDPVTPPRWAKFTQKVLINSRHIIAPGGHHNVSPRGCIPDRLKAFFSNPKELNSLSFDCVAAIKPPHFFVDAAGPAMQPYSKGQKESADD